jgi:hypothetical protein
MRSARRPRSFCRAVGARALRAAGIYLPSLCREIGPRPHRLHPLDATRVIPEGQNSVQGLSCRAWLPLRRMWQSSRYREVLPSLLLPTEKGRGPQGEGPLTPRSVRCYRVDRQVRREDPTAINYPPSTRPGLRMVASPVSCERRSNRAAPGLLRDSRDGDRDHDAHLRTTVAL